MPSIAAYALSTGIAGYSSKKIDIKWEGPCEAALLEEYLDMITTVPSYGKTDFGRMHKVCPKYFNFC